MENSSIYNDTEKQDLVFLEIDEMWKKILEFEDFNGEKMFPHLELLVQAEFFLFPILTPKFKITTLKILAAPSFFVFFKYIFFILIKFVIF